MLSKTQPHTAGTGFSALADTQRVLVEAYQAALPDGVAPRVFGSRNLVVVDDEATAERLIRRGIERSLPTAKTLGVDVPAGASQDELRALFDIHVGNAGADRCGARGRPRAARRQRPRLPVAPCRSTARTAAALDRAHRHRGRASPRLEPRPSRRKPVSDLIDELVGIEPGSPLDALRAKRPVARSDAQATYDGLITAPSDLERATATERAAIGYWVAALSRADALAGHYRNLLEAVDPAVLATIDGERHQGHHRRALRRLPRRPAQLGGRGGAAVDSIRPPAGVGRRSDRGRARARAPAHLPAARFESGCPAGAARCRLDSRRRRHPLAAHRVHPLPAARHRGADRPQGGDLTWPST